MITKNVVMAGQDRLLLFKICSVCEEEKHIRNFNKNSPTSYRSQCKKCYRSLQKEREDNLIQMHLRQGISEEEPHTCAACKQTKTRRDFHMDRSKKSGVCSTCKECAIKRTAEKYRRSKSEPNSKILQDFGITAQQKTDLLQFQGNVCAICGSNIPKTAKKTWSLDHCHATGEIRGVLCSPCNSALGNVSDSKEVLLSMINYLISFPARKFFGEPKIVSKNRKRKKRTETNLIATISSTV